MTENTLNLLAAQGMVRYYTGQFNYLYVRAASTPFQISFDGTVFKTVQRNDQVKPPAPTPAHPPLIYVFLRPLGGVDTVVTIAVGDGEFLAQDTRASSAAAATYTKATDLKGGTALAALATASFSGSDGVYSRRQITVQNLDGGANLLEVQDGAGVTLAVLAAGGPPWTLETSGIIKIYNPAGSALSRVVVGETYYL